MSVILIGPPGSGKSRLGKRVARILGLPFIDTDTVIVERHGPINRIFAEHGEPHFRRLEREAVREALAQDAVVSLGGGAILDAQTQEDLRGRRVALVTVNERAAARRIAGDSRPLVDGIESWRKLVEARRHIYERLAGRTWDTSRRPMGVLSEEIAEWARQERES